ncbi:hypothetical protein RJT34_28203 [Clitoria ternatea]|uniref:Uncharacterized protein n=1 Tax=Clitoria ternatea TaxID=43366 RepID=A0AAN9IA52_CLITE
MEEFVGYSLFDKEGRKRVASKGKNRVLQKLSIICKNEGTQTSPRPSYISLNYYACSVSAMVCLGALFGCRRSTTIVAYLLSALVTISILCVLRLLCYGLYRFLKRKDHADADAASASATAHPPPHASLQIHSHNSTQ